MESTVVPRIDDEDSEQSPEVCEADAKRSQGLLFGVECEPLESEEKKVRKSDEGERASDIEELSDEEEKGEEGEGKSEAKEGGEGEGKSEGKEDEGKKGEDQVAAKPEQGREGAGDVEVAVEAEGCSNLVVENSAMALSCNYIQTKAFAVASHENQDRIHWKLPKDIYTDANYATPIKNRKLRSLFVVCDGHGENGQHAAAFFAKALINLIEHELYYFELNTKVEYSTEEIHNHFREIITRTFLNADDTYRTLLEKSSMPFSQTGGACCTLAIVFDKYIVMGNVGDSRSIIIARSKDLRVNFGPDIIGDRHEKYQIVMSTKDHSVVSHDRYRALANGASINKEGTYITLGHYMLNITRALGDYHFKQNHDMPIVSPVPKVRMVDTSSLVNTNSADDIHLYIVLASDGLWDFVLEPMIMMTAESNEQLHNLENEAVCRIISQWINENGSLNSVEATRSLVECVRKPSHGHLCCATPETLYYDDFSTLVTSILVHGARSIDKKE